MQYDTGASYSGGTPPSAGGEFDLSNPVGSFIATVRGLVTSPVAFFRGMPRNSGYVNPLAFAVICSIIAAIPASLITALLSLFAGDVGGIIGGLGFALALLVIIPIFTVFGAFIAAAVYHLFVLLLARNRNAGFQGTFRVVCYAAFPNILTFLTFVPILGVLVSLALGVYVIVLSILGVREVHSTTSGRAAGVVLVPLAIIFVFSMIVGVIVAILAMGASSSGTF